MLSRETEGLLPGALHRLVVHRDVVDAELREESLDAGLVDAVAVLRAEQDVAEFKPPEGGHSGACAGAELIKQGIAGGGGGASPNNQGTGWRSNPTQTRRSRAVLPAKRADIEALQRLEVRKVRSAAVAAARWAARSETKPIPACDGPVIP